MRLEIRRRILIAFEAAEREADPERRRAWMTFVLVGGGPTGVELAGALGEIAHDDAQARFPSDPVQPDPGHPARGDGPDPAALSARPFGLGAATAGASRRGGPDEHAGDRTSTRTASGVTGHDGTEESIAARTVFWAAGVLTAQFARTVAAATGASTDRTGRVIVEPDLTIPGHPEIFVVGDAARGAVEARPSDAGRRAGSDAGRLLRRQGHPAPCPRAVPTRPSATATMATWRSSGALRESPTSAGSARSGGRADSRPGRCGSASTSSYLIGFSNRIVVLVRWAWTFLTHGRGVRLITGKVLLPPIEEPEPPVLAPMEPG